MFSLESLHKNVSKISINNLRDFLLKISEICLKDSMIHTGGCGVDGVGGCDDGGGDGDDGGDDDDD